MEREERNAHLCSDTRLISSHSNRESSARRRLHGLWRRPLRGTILGQRLGKGLSTITVSWRLKFKKTD